MYHQPPFQERYEEISDEQVIVLNQINRIVSNINDYSKKQIKNELLEIKYFVKSL